MKNIILVFFVILILVLLWLNTPNINISLHDGYIIKGNTISGKCSLYSPKGKMLLDRIGEWMEAESFIYGYGDGSKYCCYIYSKLTDSCKFFDNSDDFYAELKKLNLKYNMTDSKDLGLYD